MPAQFTKTPISSSILSAPNNTQPTIPVLSRWLGSWNIQVHRKCHSAEKLSETYDALSGTWDETLGRFETADAYLAVLFSALSVDMISDSHAALRVLDCGTGTGAFLTAFADLVSGRPDLHGVDISEGMLERARLAMAAQGHQAHFRSGDVNRLPYPDRHFDVVLAAHVIEHVADPQAALAEMRRVLKPGGLLVICVTRKSVVGRTIQLRWRTHAIDDQDGEAWLVKAGFECIENHQAPENCHFDGMSVALSARKPKVNIRLVSADNMEADHV